MKFVPSKTLSVVDTYTDWYEGQQGESQIIAFQCVDGGSWNGTLRFEGTLDGTNAVPVLAVPANSTTGATTATTANIYRCDVSGGVKVRVYADTVSAGSMVITAGGR